VPLLELGRRHELAQARPVCLSLWCRRPACLGGGRRGREEARQDEGGWKRPAHGRVKPTADRGIQLRAQGQVYSAGRPRDDALVVRFLDRFLRLTLPPLGVLAYISDSI
jgi:hypothetical protein